MYQALNHQSLNNFHGPRRGHHAAPAPSSILDHLPAALRLEVLGLFLLVETADRFCWSMERRIVGVNDRLGHHRHHAFADVPGAKFVAQHLLNQVADRSLGLGAQHVKRKRWGDPRGELAAEEVEPHLGTVPVGEDHVPPRGQHASNVATGLAQGLDLAAHAGMVFVFDEGVAPDGDDGNGHDRLLVGLKVPLSVRYSATAPPLLALILLI